MPDVKDAVAVGILVLCVAVFVPTLVDGTQNDKTAIAEIEENSTFDYTDKLSVEAVSVSQSSSSATIEVRNSETFESSQKVLNASESKVYQVGGENVTATLEQLRFSTGGEYATVSVSYPPTFGFGDASKDFFENMEIVIVLVGFIIVLGVLGVVSKP
jgi:hypothetical protein